MKPIRLSGHAKEQLQFRGTNLEEVEKAIQESEWELSRKGRLECRMNFPFGKTWNKKRYKTKQVRPIFRETENDIIVITVYTYYFD